MHSFTLDLAGPCDFQQLLIRIRQSSHGAFFREQSDRLGRVLRLEGQPYFVEFAPSSESAWQVWIPDGTAALQAEATAQLVDLFALDVDLAAFYQHAAHDPVTASLVNRLAGARMMRDGDLFSSVISSIISQQMNLAFAAQLKRQLWSRCGEPVVVGGQTLYADPLPEAVARLDYGELRSWHYSQRKSEYVVDFARAVVCGEFDLQRLPELDDEAAISCLCSQRGLGRWTAECVLLFGLGRPDLLPAKDVGLQRAVARFWQLAERPNEVELRQRALSWRPWSSWYTYYLWLGLTL